MMGSALTVGIITISNLYKYATLEELEPLTYGLKVHLFNNSNGD